MQNSNNSDSTIIICVIIGIIGIVILSWIKENLKIIINALIIIGISALAILILTLISIKIIKKINKNKQERTNFMNDLKEFTKYDYLYSNDVKTKLEELNKIIKDDPELSERFKNLIKKIKIKLNSKYRKLKTREEQKIIKEQKQRQKELKEQEIEELREKQTISKLLKYFKKKKTNKAIPDWAINLGSSINEAKNQYNYLLNENKRKAELWDEAVNFVRKYKAYPVDFSHLSKDQQNNYKKAIKLLKQGKLNLEPKVLEADKELVKRNFILASELEPEQRERFLKKYGYRHKSFIHLNGKSGNNLIIRNDEKKETDYHFCIKNMFYRMDKRAKLEYSVEGLRADVVFILNNKKIAVEIETGKNKEMQYKNKIEWLNRNFDYWIFVVSRKNESKYNKYVDNIKSFCFTLKEASEKVRELLC